MTTTTEARWTTDDAVRASGATNRQLQHWRIRGYVRPDLINRGNGAIRWPFEEIVRAAVLRDVIGAHAHTPLTIGAARRIAAASLADGAFLVIEPHQGVLTADEVLDLVRTNDCVSAVPLAAARERVRNRLDALDA